MDRGHLHDCRSKEIQHSQIVLHFLKIMKMLFYYYLKTGEELTNNLIKQIEAGAEVIQIFESHAKVAADENKFKLYCIDPSK